MDINLKTTWRKVADRRPLETDLSQGLSIADAATEEEIDPSKQFTGVFQSTIGRHHLLYGAEMDCVLESEATNKEHIELKVCAGKSLSDLPFQQ